MAVTKIDGVDGQFHTHRQILTMYATEAVAIGQVVQFDEAASAARKSLYGSERLVRVADVTGSVLACGVAMTACDAPATGLGSEVRVQVGGFIRATDAHNPTADGSGISAGDLVQADTVTDGRIMTGVAPTAVVSPFGVCLDAYTAATADGSMFIYNRFFQEG
jgi:hypothetical protein